MCGIAGLLDATPESRVPERRLDQMIDALSHRGPDDTGRFVAGSLGIGMRRLSIIDLAGGHQPMLDPERRIAVVYNGECYNHEELRRELERAGARFRTRCDTEVVLHGFRAWGIKRLAERMNGIYAFCVLDCAERAAFLCRDRLGVKPLYYTHRGPQFAFASELRALAKSGMLTAKIDETALLRYLLYQFAPGQRSLLAGASRLLPGHILRWQAGSVSLDRYWSLPDEGEDTVDRSSDRAIRLRELLWDVVRRQMMSDVPVGCFLSGGLDSTIVASMMAQISTEPIRTFSIAFPGNPDCDESAYFEQTARILGSRHQTIEFSDKSVLDTLDDFAWCMDEPVADPAMLPTYYLARAAGREVKVVLTGEGADEAFNGYSNFRRFVLPNQAAPSSDVISWWQVSCALSERFGARVLAPRNDLRSELSDFPYALDPAFVWNLIHPERRPPVDHVSSLAQRIETPIVAGRPRWSALQRATAIWTELWLADDLMPKLDKMTMAHSLEGRVPFLDHRLVELAFNTSGKQKIGPEHGKLLLREAVRGIIPSFMLQRRKQGFNVPLYEWFQGPLHQFARDALLGGILARSGLLNPQALEVLLFAHQDLNLNVARPIWELICLDRWFERVRAELTEAEHGAQRPFEPACVRELDATIEGGVCDIVIPVYQGVNYVRDLLRTIGRNTDYPYRLVLVDDSDDDATHEALAELVAGESRATLLRNPENLGFIRTCNIGAARSRSEFVCILNTDTLVSAGWLGKLVRCARSDERIAVVNPLSNMCVNLSVPMPPGLNLNTMATQLERFSPARYPDITTAVGFCMLIRRRHLDWLGGFDPVFGLGYCEESDLCMRYTEAGLRVVAADDAFVYHKGCGSFGTWLERYVANRKIFDARWEDAYVRDYARFLSQNPLQRTRDALLRFTVDKADWSRAAAFDLERSDRGLVAECLDCVPLDQERAPRARRPRHSVRRRLRDVAAGVEQRPRTGLDPQQRRIRYPTLAHIARTPSTDGLRVTFLVDEMPICGGITSIVQLAREMTIEGHDVKIVTTTEQLEPERFNLPCQPLVYPNKEELVRLFPPSDIVLATYWTTAYEWMRDLRASHDFVSAYFIQDYEVYFYPEEQSEMRERVRSTYRMTDHRIVKSRWLHDLLQKNHGLDSDLVHLGLDLGIFRPRRRSAEVSQRPRVLSVARPYEPRRGFAELVEAFRLLKTRRPDVELVLFGVPDEDLPTNLPFVPINKGRLVDLADVARLIGSCDLLVDSSLFQGFGRPGLEAMACGTPCVLTSEGGVREYARDEDNCLLVPPGDPASLARAMQRLIENQSLRQKVRESGIATARAYCHRDEARRHVALYETWLRAYRDQKRDRAS